MAQACVRTYRGRPTLFVDDKPIPFNAYSPTTRRELFFKQTERFFKHDTRVFFINVPRAVTDDNDYCATPFWFGDEISSQPLLPPQTLSLDEQASFILEHQPEAFLFVRFGNNEPASWRELHPDELFVNEQGDVLACPSLASNLYIDAFSRYVAAVIEHCEQQPWADRIIGYWTGMRCEGTHEPLMHGWLYDHSPRMREAWQDLTGSGTPPTDALLDPNQSASSYFQSASSNKLYRTYLQLCRRLFAKQVEVLSQAHQAAPCRDRVFVVDAFKQVMQGWDNHAFFDEQKNETLNYHDMLAGSGHTAIDPLLDLPGIDGVITPHDYQARGSGGIYEPEGPADSMVLRGKLFLCEMDTRSWTGVDDPVFGSAPDAQTFAGITWRNIASTVTRGFHSYTMDVFTDWFADDAIQQILGEQMRLINTAMQMPHREVPGIAVIVDDEAVLETNGNGSPQREAVMRQIRGGLSRCGVPYRVYLLDDLPRLTDAPHQVYFFPNLYRMDEERLAMLQQTVLRDDRVVVWGPGSGISDGKKLSVESAERLTGMKFAMLNADHSRAILVCDSQHTITQHMTPGEIIASPLPYGPVLFPDSGTALSQAWTKQGRHQTGLAVDCIEEGGRRWTSVFTTVLPMPAGFWRGVAQLAGTHVYCESNDVIMASEQFVAIHATHAGRKVVHLPQPSMIHSAMPTSLDNDIVNRPISSLDISMTFGQTQLWCLES